MDRIIKEFDFLYKLSKSKSSRYRQLILLATPDQIRAIVYCVSICYQLKTIRDRKSLRSIGRRYNFKNTLKVLRRNRTLVQAVLFSLLLRLIRATIDQLENGV